MIVKNNLINKSDYTSKNILISVIVPTYNEESSIVNVIKRLNYLKEIIPLEIIVVDDGSIDETSKSIINIKSINLIQHDKNYGKGAAIKTGLKNAKGNIIVIQDADLEYYPEEIPILIQPILEGNADVVYGSRFMGKIEGMTLSHTIGNKILSLISQILFQKPITDVMTGHKAFDKKVFDIIDFKEKRFGFEVEITAKILKKKIRFKEIPIPYTYRTNGISKITFKDGFSSIIKLIFYKLIY